MNLLLILTDYFFYLLLNIFQEDACEREASERNKEKTGLEETVNIESIVDEGEGVTVLQS